MICLLFVLMCAGAETQPATVPVPLQLEDAITTEKDPNGKHIMVTTHILVENANAKEGLHVKFIDSKRTPGVNIKKWDPKLSTLMPNTTIVVTGELHYGAVSGHTPSIRYKVTEVGGKKYTDHRHWRTDKAIYIVNPTYVVSDGAPPKEEKDDEKPAKDEKPAAK